MQYDVWWESPLLGIAVASKDLSFAA